jgi:hypothetical protein
MITVFVRDENGIDIFCAGTCFKQANLKIAQSKSAINQQSGGVPATLGFNQSGIA